MKSLRMRRSAVSVAAVSALALFSAACTPPPPPPLQSFSFKANSVTINDMNDIKLCVPFTNICTGDEPFVVNIAFKVKIGVPNSATTQVVTGANHWPGFIDEGPTEGSSHNYSGAEQGAIGLNDISMVDVGDLANGEPLELAGVWAWAMEADLFSPGGISASADVLRTALNALANGALPGDPNSIVSTILTLIGGAGGVFSFLGANLGSIFFGDDAIGSRLYIGVGARDGLSDIIGATAAAIPALAIPFPVQTPPDISGGAIFSLGAGTRSFTGQSMTNGNVDGRHTYSYTLTAL